MCPVLKCCPSSLPPPPEFNILPRGDIEASN